MGNLTNAFMRLIPVFAGKTCQVQGVTVAEAVSMEVDSLWTIVKERKEGLGNYSEQEFADKIQASFMSLRTRFSDEQLDGEYMWPRFVKIAVQCIGTPVNFLVEYVSKNNYISLTKKMSDLVNSISRSEGTEVSTNAERLSEAVYRHILENIDPADIPSCLSLGRAAQMRGDFEEARMWFKRITEGEDPFNGITAMLACYEEEVKTILSLGSKNYSTNPKLKERVRELNKGQCSVYEEWCHIMEERLRVSEDEEDKKKYVQLMTGYARLERKRGNYDKSLSLLERIPKIYPDMYRVYAEEAMLYQCRSFRNRYYSPAKAIETFKKADAAINDNMAACKTIAISKKSILVPLANTYFASGMYTEASDVCDIVLKIDKKEQRAIELKKRIMCMAS